MIVIGLTGGVGTGKSTVAAMLARRGAVVIDADHLAHEALAPGTATARAIARRFGRRVVNDDGALDRFALSRWVFRSRVARRALEAIVHPHVYRRLRQELRRAKASGAGVVALDVPLLLETGGQRLADLVVVVAATPASVRTRLRARGWSTEDIDRRGRAQWALSKKLALADALVENSDGLEHTRRQVSRLWKRLQEARASRKPRG